jgi:hypothetical protein
MRLPRRGEWALSMTALSAASVGMTFWRQGLGFRVQDLGFRDDVLETGFRVQGSGFRV